MSTVTRAAYEAMFLISQGEAADLAGVIAHITDIITRHNGELIAMKKWDERRLAYEIDKQRRGIYLLVYFYADGPELSPMERDINLSERILRQLILRVDHMNEDQMRGADARQELEVEAKLRAERAAETAGRDGSVSLGRGDRDDVEASESVDQIDADAESEDEIPDLDDESI